MVYANCEQHVGTNFWKSFVHSRLKMAMGDEGCLSLFGDQPERHRLLAEQLTAEYPVTTAGRGRTVEEWKQRVERPDNHWCDCLVGCAVGGSMLGAALASEGSAKARKRYSLEEMARMANGPTARELAEQARKGPDWLAWTRER